MLKFFVFDICQGGEWVLASSSNNNLVILPNHIHFHSLLPVLIHSRVHFIQTRLDILGHFARIAPYPVVLLLVVQPHEQQLLVDELATLGVHDLLEELLVLKHLEKTQTLRVNEMLAVLGLFPVHQVLQVVEERLLLEVATLSEEIQVIRVG